MAKQEMKNNHGGNSASIENISTLGVETDLFIGLPETRVITLPLHMVWMIEGYIKFMSWSANIHAIRGPSNVQ